MSLFGAASNAFGVPQQSFLTTAAPQQTGFVTQTNAVDKDIEVAQPPTDSISSLSFSPQAEFLAVSSWDNAVRVYGIEANGSTSGKASYQHEGPVLDCTWSKDGTKILSGGADKAGRMFDVNTGQSSQVAAHDAPIKGVRWIDLNGGILATGSWDKTVKYWDLRQQQPAATAQLAERCYSMDVAGQYMVVATAERKIQIFDLQANPAVPVMTIDSPLKWQTRVVTCFQRSDPPGQTFPPGFAVGSVEGRVAMQYIKEENKGSNFSFKCHRKDAPQPRDPQQLYSVNAINFHPVQGTFSTAGSDGTINFWDKDSKTRLKTFEAKPGPIAATAFNRNGSIFAYAVSYDWHKGYQFAGPNNPNQIFLHATKEDEVKRRPKKN